MSTQRDHETYQKNLFFVSLVEWVINHPKTVVTFTLMITLITSIGILSRLSINNGLEMFTPSDSPAVHNRELYRDLFGRDDLFMISARGEVFTQEYLGRIKRLEDELSRLNLPIKSLGQRLNSSTEREKTDVIHLYEPLNELSMDPEEDSAWLAEDEGTIIEETTSIVSARRTYSLDGALKIEPWFDPLPEQKGIDELKSVALSDPLLARRIVNRDGRLSVILVRVMIMSDDDMLKVYQALNKLCDQHRTQDFELKVTGSPAVTAALNMIVIEDLSRLLGFSGLAMFLALLYLFRSRFMVIGPIVVVGLSVIWTLGLMAFTGMSLNILSSILPAFLLCVGLGDSIHFQSIFQSLRKQGHCSREAIGLAGGMTGSPILFTSLTTMIGLLSFQFASVTAIQEMGLSGGLGVMFALLHSLITLPLFLKWQGEEGSPQASDQDKLTHTRATQDRIDLALNQLVKLSLKTVGRRVILTLSFILFCIALYGASTLQVWHDDIATLPDEHPIKSAVLEVDKELGGVANVQIVIDASQLAHGVKNIKLLEALNSFSEDLLAYETPTGERIVGHALSITHVLKETGRAVHRDGINYQIPSSHVESAQEEASQLLSLFELQSPEQLRRLTTIDLKYAHLTLQVKWQEATSYTGLIDHINAGIKRYLEPLHVSTRPTGGVYLAHTVISSLLGDLVKSFLAAFAVITILMILMLRGLKLGLLAMIPNLLPIILMLGSLGLLGIPLDLNNLLVASISLGIAVDDTIHLLHHFQVSYRENQNTEKAIFDAVRHAGRAMLSTSVLLCVGFSVYLFASTTAVSRFGVVISATVMVALLVDLILCPAILRISYRNS